MKHLNRFNESEESKDIRLTMSELEAINPGIQKSHYFKDDQEFIVAPNRYGDRKGMFGGKEATAYGLYTVPDEKLIRDYPNIKYGSQLGYAIMIDGEVKHAVTFYEPHGCRFIEGKDLFVAYGHENILLLFSDGSTENIRTR